MLDDILHKMQEKEKSIRQNIAEIVVHDQSSDGIIHLSLDGENQLRDLSIDLSRIEDVEMLEDLLITTLNRAHADVNRKVAELTKQDMSDLLPPGLDKLFGI